MPNIKVNCVEDLDKILLICKFIDILDLSDSEFERLVLHLNRCANDRGIFDV